MKKIIIVSTALFISLNSFAQFGVVAGLTMSSAHVNNSTTVVDSRSIINFHAGASYKIGLGKGDEVFVIQPSLLYNVKGAWVFDSNNREVKSNTGYIELPVQLQIGIPFGSVCRIYGIVEPFVGYAVTNKVDGITLNDKWDNVSNRFEYGANLGAGLELFEHLQFSVRYSLNLENAVDFVMQQVLRNLTLTRKGVSFSVAYIF